MSKMNKWYEKLMKEIGYQGCRNCEHKIGPLRGCEWLERGGDGILHIICPKWGRRTDEHNTEGD